MEGCATIHRPVLEHSSTSAAPCVTVTCRVPYPSPKCTARSATLASITFHATAAVKASTTSVAYLWRIERGRFPTFKAMLLPPASPLPPSPPSTYGSDALAVAAGNDGVVYLASSNGQT